MAWELCSKDDVMDIHPVPESELKDSWSDQVEGLIREHMGAPYLGTSAAITDEYHNGDGTHLLFVKYPPIISVQSITAGDVALTSADYVIRETSIALLSYVFPVGTMNVKISYTSGGAVPESVRLAATTMIVAIINYKRMAGADGSLKWGSAEKKAGEDTPNRNVGLTSHLKTIMKRLIRRPRLRVR